jgi:capsular exopolysaccharide synthesis family protein
MTGQNTGEFPLDPQHAPLSGLELLPGAGGRVTPLRRVAVMVLGGLAAAGVGLGVWQVVPARSYEVRVLLNVPPNSATDGETPDVSLKRLARSLTSRDRLALTLRDPEVAALGVVRRSADPVGLLERLVRVDVVAPRALAVRVTGDRPEELETIAEAFARSCQDDTASAEFARRSALRDQYGRIKDALHDRIAGERKAAEGRPRPPADGNDPRFEALRKRLSELDAELAAKEQGVRRARAAVTATEKVASPAPDDATLSREIDAHPRVAPIVARKVELDRKLAGVRAIATNDDVPAVRELRERSDATDRSLDEARRAVRPEVERATRPAAHTAAGNRAAALERELTLAVEALAAHKKFRDELASRVAVAESRPRESPAGGGQPNAEELARLDAELAKLDVGPAADEPIRGRSPATAVPTRAGYLRAALVAAAGLLSFLAVAGLVGYRGRRERRVGGTNEVADDLGIPLLGTIPTFPRHTETPAAARRAALSEAVDATRSAVLREARQRSMRVLLVTSATPGEGKTSSACQLGSSLAGSGLRTLVVDCDLRNPSVHAVFDLPPSPGVGEVLVGEADVRAAVLPTLIPNLWAFPAGRLTPAALAALVQGNPTASLVRRLRDEFDFVLVDSCPVLSAADALLVGQHADGAVLSLMQDVSRVPTVRAAAGRLEQVNVPLLGAVLNGTRPPGS